MFATPAAARQAAREIRKQVAELRRDKKAALVDIATSCTLTRTRTGNAMKALRKAAAELVKARKAELVTQRKAACDKTPKARRAKAAAVKRAEEALAQAETAAAVIAGEAAAATMPAAVEAALIEAEAPALVPIWRELAPAITPEQAATVPDAVELLVEYVKQNPTDVAAAIERSGEAIAAEIEAPAPPPPGALVVGKPKRKTLDGGGVEWVVPVGSVELRIFRDTDQFGSSMPIWYAADGDSKAANGLSAEGGFLGQSQNEALDALRKYAADPDKAPAWFRSKVGGAQPEPSAPVAVGGELPPEAPPPAAPPVVEAPPAPVEAPPAPPSVAENEALALLGVKLEPLPREAVVAAYRNTSHTPEKRADSTQERYRAELESFAAELVSSASADDLPALREKFRAFVDGYRSRVLAALAADARTASAMIVGPSKFPTERNRKALATAEKRWKEVREYRENGKRRLLKEVTGRVGISSDDPNAPDALRAKLAELEERDQEIEEIKRVASDRKLSTEERKRRLMELGLPGFQAETGAARGWAPLQFMRSNLRQEIQRVKERIAQLERKRAESTSELTVTYDGKPVRVVDDVEANRLQIFFQGKPSPATIARLKERGFKWAPSVGAWQRFRSEQAKYQAGQILNHSMDALGKAPVVDRTEPVISAEVDARRVGELRAMLTAAGYRGELAEQLASEGVGADELATRLRVRPGDVGSLEFTHGAQRAAPPPPAESLEDRVSPALPPPAPPPAAPPPPSAAQVERAREAIERALAGGPLEHAALHRRVDPAASHAATDQALEQLEAAALVERLDQGGELHYRRTTPARPAEGFRPAATPGQTGALFEEVEPAPLPAELAALGVPVRFQGDALAGYLIAPELVDAASNVIPVPVDSEAARHFDRPEEKTGNEDDAARQGLVLVQLGPPMNEEEAHEAGYLQELAAEYAEEATDEGNNDLPFREFFPVMWDHGQPLGDRQRDALAVGTVRAVRVLGIEPVKALARKGVFFSPYDSPFAPRVDWERDVPPAELRQAGVFGLFPVVIDIARALAEGGPAGAERRRKEAEEDDAAAVASYHQQEQNILALEERIAEIKTRSQPIPHLSVGGNFKITGRLPRVENVIELNEQDRPTSQGPGYVLASMDGVRLTLMARTGAVVLTTLDGYPIVQGNTLAQGVYLLENFAPFFRAAKRPDLAPLQRIRRFTPRELAQGADPLTVRLYELVRQSAELPSLYHWPNPGYVQPSADNRGAWPRYQGEHTTAEQLGEMGPHVVLGTAQGGRLAELGVAVWEQRDGFAEVFLKVRLWVYGETGYHIMFFAPPELLPTQQIPGRSSRDVLLRIAPSFNELRPFLEQLLAHYFPELVRHAVSTTTRYWHSLDWKSAPDLVSYWRSAWSGYGERLPDALSELEAERHRDRIKDTSLPGFARPGQKIAGPWGASAADGRVMAWNSAEPGKSKQWRYGAKLEPFRSLVAEAVKNTLNATKGQGDWSLLTWGVAGYLNEALLKKDPAQKWIVAAQWAPKSDPEALGTLEPLDLIERDGAFALTREKPGAFGLTWLPSGANATTLHTNERAAKQVFRTLAPKIERSTKDDWNDREANRFRMHGWNKISGDVIGGIVKTTEEQLKSAAASKKAESKAASEKGAEELAILNLNRFVDEGVNPPDDNNAGVTVGKYEIRARWSYQRARQRDPDRSHDLAFGTIELRERLVTSRDMVWRARFLFDMGPGASALHHLLRELLNTPTRYLTAGALDELVKAIKSNGSDGTQGVLSDSPKATAEMGRELLGLAVGLYTRTTIPKEAPYALVLAPTAELKPDEAPPGFQGVTTLYGAIFFGMPVKGDHFGVNRDNGLASLDLGGSFGLKVPKHAKTVVAKLDAAFPEPLIYGLSELREGMLNMIPAFGQNPQAALDAWASGKPLRTSNPAGNGGDSGRARCQAARDEIRAVELDQRALLARLLEIKRHELTEARVAACEAPRAALRKKFDAKIDKLLREARDLEQTARDMTRTALPPLSKATSDSLIEATLGAVEPRLVPLWRELASKIEAPTASGRMEAFLAYARDHESDAQRAQKTDPDTADLPPVQLDEGAGDEPQAPPGDLLDELQAAMPDWSITVKPTSNDHTRWFASAVYQKTSKKAPKVEHSASAPTRARALGRLIRQWIFKGGGATVDERRRLKAIWDRRVDVRTENPSSPDPEDVVLSAALVAELLGLGLAQARETGPRFASFVEDYLDRRTGGAGFRVVWASRGPEQLSDAANRQSIERILRDAARAWRSQDPDDWSELDDASSNPSGGHEREVFERETASMVGWANAELPGFLRRYQPRRTGIFLRGGSSFTRYMDDARRSFEARYPGEPLTVAARMFQQARGIVGAMQHDSLGAVSYGIKMDAWDRKAAELLGRSPNPGGGDARAARVWIEDGKVKVQAPFALPFQRRALQLGGRWNASARHWFFPESEAARVRSAVREVYDSRTANPCGCGGQWRLG